MRDPRSKTLLRLGATALLSFAVAYSFAVSLAPARTGDAVTEADADDGGRVATLDVLLDGPDLFVDLDVSAETLLGFAHAPTSRAEHEAMVRAFHRLDAGDLIVATPEARCTLAESFATVGHGYDDLCSAADVHALDPADAIDRERRAASPAIVDGPRPDVAARWSWHCAAPGRLRTLEVRLFDAFDRVDGADVELWLDDAERSLTLVPSRPRIDLRRAAPAG